MQPMKQDAIVLGGVDYSDSSRVVWVLTPDFGRQSLMVKGARRQKSRFMGGLETFSLVRLIYRKGSRGSMPTLREADVQRQWEGIRSSLDAFLSASEAVEIIKAVCAEEQESSALFSLLSDFLVFCDSHGDAEYSLRLALIAFRWRLASILGVAPQLLECLNCARTLQRQPKYRFLISGGGILCPDCEGSATESSVGCMIDYPGLRFLYRSLRRFPGPDEEPAELSEESIAIPGTPGGPLSELSSRREPGFPDAVFSQGRKDRTAAGKRDTGARMRNPLKTEFVTSNYRTIIFSLVLLNTALIFFLIVFIWSYDAARNTRDLLSGAVNQTEFQPGMITQDNVIAWSRPGGAAFSAASRGILERGRSIRILGSEEAAGELWLKINWDSREGWVQARRVRYIR